MPNLSAENLTVVQQRTRRSWFHYGMNERKHIDSISFHATAGKCFAVVGELDSGKLPLALALMRLIPITEGTVTFDGSEISALSPRRFRPFRKRMQIVFSDAFGQLTPGLTLNQAFYEVLRLWHRKLQKDDIHTRIEQVMVATGLAASVRHLFPVELDAVERQMAAVARALLIDPQLLLCHDLTHGLDAVEQAEILNRMKEIRETMGLSLFWITDDLAVAHHMSDEMAILHRGKILESGESERVVNRPEHDYTQRLVSSIQ